MTKPKDVKTLGDMLIEKQTAMGAADRSVAEQIGILQQTYSTWKHGVIPGRAWHERICEFLDVSIDELQAILEATRIASGTYTVIRLQDFYKASQYGAVSNAAEGEFLFEPTNVGRKRVPEGRYMTFVKTDVMEPAIRSGSPCWFDIMLWPSPGTEVMVHSTDGVAYIGQLVSTSNRGAKIRQLNPERVLEVQNVLAIHTVVLTQRVVIE